MLLSNPITILILSALFGVTVKIADLLDEHGLKLFRGAPILFGFLWGIIGSLMFLSNQLVAMFILAILIHWVLRYRIDYLNHGIAAVIILMVFLYNLPNLTMNWTVFLIIFIPYSILGLLNDAVDRGEIKGIIAKLIRSNSHYIIFPLILIFINANYWIILGVSLLHLLFYELTTGWGMKIIKRQKQQLTDIQ